jgi:hypothetical protein
MRVVEFHLQLRDAFNLQLRPLFIRRIGIQNVSNPPIPGWHYFVSISGLCVSFFVVDRIPRNVILAVGRIAVAILLACDAAIASLFVGTTNKSGLAAGVAFLYIYIWLYGIFLDGPGYFYVRICGSGRFGTLSLTVYLQANEIFPTHLRGKGATCCVAS